MAEKKIIRDQALTLYTKTGLLVLFLIILLICTVAKVWAQDSVRFRIGEFSRSVLDGWKSKKFVKTTIYDLVTIDKKVVLKAVSRSSASGMVKKVRVDLDKTPYLNWQWRIENKLDGTYDETTRQGDDYAARIYVVVSGGLTFWNTKALNYVWAKHAQKGAVWQNACTGKNAMMMAVRAQKDPLSQWQTEKRNIQTDFKKCFGKNIQYIDAVALMSDTDNTKNQVTAIYGDIYFSAE